MAAENFFPGRKSVTALDWSDNGVKLVHVRKSDKGALLAVLDYAEAGGGSDNEIVDAVKGMLARHKVPHADIILCMPRHLVTKRLLRLPSHNPDELRRMAELQAVKQLPYSREEIVADFEVVRLNPDGFADVFLVLAQRKTVDNYLKIASECGLAVERMALSSEGLLMWLNAVYQAKDGLPAAVIDIDRHHTQIAVAKDGTLLFSRSVSFDGAAAADHYPSLLNEARVSFDAYTKEGGEGIGRILVSGAVDHADAVINHFSGAFSIPVEYLPPLKCVSSAPDDLVKAASKASFSALLGLALYDESLSVNLLPAEMLRKKAERDIKAAFVTTGILGLCILAASAGIVQKHILEKKKALNIITGKMDAMDPEAKRLSRLLADIGAIEGQMAFSGSSIDVLRELYSLIPADISLTVFEYEAANRAILRGTAKELAVVFGLLPKLEASAYFENVRVAYATKRRSGNKQVADFEIVCPLSKPGAQEGVPEQI